MPVSNQNFIAIKEKITHAMQHAAQMDSSKLDECSKLILLNSQFATTLELFTEKIPEMLDGEIAEFLLDFSKEVENLESIVDDFVISIQ